MSLDNSLPIDDQNFDDESLTGRSYDLKFQDEVDNDFLSTSMPNHNLQWRTMALLDDLNALAYKDYSSRPGSDKQSGEEIARTGRYWVTLEASAIA